jgi:glucan biosynthesis protein
MDSKFFARRAARVFLAGVLLVFLSSAHVASAFDFDDVAALARRKARAPYKPPDRAQPAELEALGYDRYRDIRFRPDRAVWRTEGLLRPDVLPSRPGNPRVRMSEVVATLATFRPAPTDFGRTLR